MAIEGYKIYTDDGVTHLFVADKNSVGNGIISFTDGDDWVCSFVQSHVISMWPIENIDEERDIEYMKSVLKG
jgi:hypothetical protein